jgi:hypothetical protein
VRGVLICVDRSQDLLQHTVGVSQHVIIPETQNDVFHGLEDLGPVGVSISGFIMLATVELDDELHVLTDEINDKSINRHLLIEFQTGESAITQAKPQHAFGVGLMAAQVAGKVVLSSTIGNPLTPTLSPDGEREPHRARRISVP